MRFLHRIGKSTVTQGITVPEECQGDWVSGIAKGQHVQVTINLANKDIKIDLRRLNNSRGHLQFRYERREHEELREYFKNLALSSKSEEGCVIEIYETDQGIFRVTPLVGFDDKQPRLSICRPIFHLFELSDKYSEFDEITEAISDIPFMPNYTQKDYNLLIHENLKERKWLTEERVHDGIGLKCDFRKNGTWLEVEFGNARTYYQDYMKFLIAAEYKEYKYGILLCPTSTLAGYLCELGRQRAQSKKKGSMSYYSGMMTYEKAVKELPYIQHVLDKKVVIGGLDVNGEIVNITKTYEA